MSKKPVGRHYAERQLIFDDHRSPGNDRIDYELDLESMAASVMDVKRREDYWLDPLP